MSNVLNILDRSGDTAIAWNDADTTRIAREKFQSLKIAGYSLFKLEGPES